MHEESERKLFPLYRERESNPPSAWIPLSVLGKRAWRLVCRFAAKVCTWGFPADPGPFAGEEQERGEVQVFLPSSGVAEVMESGEKTSSLWPLEALELPAGLEDRAVTAAGVAVVLLTGDVIGVAAAAFAEAAAADFLAKIKVGFSRRAAGFVGSLGFWPGGPRVADSFRKWLVVVDLDVVADVVFVVDFNEDVADVGWVFPR